MIQNRLGGRMHRVPEQHALEDGGLELAVHELSNLMTIVIGFAEVAVGQVGEGHPAASSLREVLDASESAGSLARMLQDVACEPSEGEPRLGSLSAAASGTRWPHRAVPEAAVGSRSSGADASGPCRSAGSATLHEVSNLLTSIALFSALCLKKLPDDDPMCADLREIHRASEQAVSLAAAWV